MEITSYEINKDSLKIYDESHNILNQIGVEDVNKTQANLEKEMVDRAKDYGLLKEARTNAETTIKTMLENADDEYTVEIEWQE